jgi:signal transduction histidine kinase
MRRSMSIGFCHARLATLVLVVCLSARAVAQPRQTLAQMDHAMWTARSGAPQAIKALAQAADGTLWIGSESGLVNFDGRTFRAYQSPAGEPELPAVPIYSLLIARDGTLWVGFFQAGAARITPQHVTVYDTADGQPLSIVESLREAADGGIWAIANRQQLIRFGKDGAWRLESMASTSRPRGLFIDSSNTLWLVQDGHLHRRPLWQTSYVDTGVPGEFRVGFAETPDGSIWMTDVVTDTTDVVTDTLDGRTQLIDPLGRLVGALRFAQLASDIISAPDGSLILPLQNHGLRRLSAKEISAGHAAGATIAPDTFSTADGLSSDSTWTAMLDADGNIWVGGLRGLDRLRTAEFTAFRSRPQEDVWSVCASTQGELWILTRDGQLYQGAREARSPFPDVGDAYSIACAPGGYAWLATAAGILEAHAGRIARLPNVPRIRPYQLMQVVAASDHTLYGLVSGTAGSGGGVWRYAEGQWARPPGEGVLGVEGAVMHVDWQDRLWIGQDEGRVTLLDENGSRLLSSGQPGLGHVFTVLQTTRGVFAAGTNGLAVLRETRFEMLAFADASARGVRGLVESRDGDLWLNGVHGIVHVTAGELDTALGDATHRMKAELITEGELAGASQKVLRLSTAARDADGALWFATRNGVFNLDPERRRRPRRPPIVTIRSMAADGTPVDGSPALGPRPRTLVIQYIGVNLTAPDNVIYRYRLQGLEDTRQDAGHRTETVYSRLQPGTYTFSVMASNGDGTWTTPVSSTPFRVLPSFYQTVWFAVLCGLAGVGVLWFAIAMRVRAITRVVRARAEERADERIRIARELHDTLLQSFQGLMLRFQSARQLLPAQPAKAVEALDGALDRADQAIAEGRDAIQNLRSSTTVSNELAQAIASLAEELTNGPEKGAATFRMAVEGSPRDLNPIVRDDIYRIAREALLNAFRHAQAGHIEAEVAYGASELRVRIRDDGTGIDPQHLNTGRSGHWGLTNMRERAQQIGSELSLWSEMGAGTELELRVPDSVAYMPSGRLGSVRRLFGNFVRKDSTDER